LNKLLLIVIAFVFFSCKKSNEPILNYHYNYFPNDIGRYVTYQVEDIVFTSIGTDTANYFLKEIITEDFFDDEGNLVQRLERYKADSLNGDFTISDAWVIAKSQTNAVKTEENIKYIKLQFPVKEFSFWNGNAYNTEDELSYSYDSLFTPREFNQLQFDSTIKVNQLDNFNAVEYQMWNEIYAANVGMIYKEYIDLSINQFNVNDINEGRKLFMTVVEYGKE